MNCLFINFATEKNKRERKPQAHNDILMIPLQFQQYLSQKGTERASKDSKHILVFISIIYVPAKENTIELEENYLQKE